MELAHQGNNITIICGQTTQAQTSAVEFPRGLNVHSVSLRVPYVRWIDFSRKCWVVIKEISSESTIDAIVAFGARTFPHYAFRMLRRLRPRLPPLLCYYAIDSMLSEYERTKAQYVSKGAVNFARTWAWYRALVDSDKKASRQADIVLASCRDTAERIEADYDIDSRKVRVVYLGVPDDFASNSYSTRQDCVFLHVCTDTSAERKGTRYFLQALRLLQAEYGIHAKGMVVGPCNTYKRFAEGLDVEFIDRRAANRNMQYYYSKCTAVVAPSLSEGFCLPVVEAMMFGKPAIASCAGSLPELIDDRVNGFLIPPQNITLIAEKMHIFMSNSELVQQMGAECRKRAKKFTISETSAALCKLLDLNKLKGEHRTS